MRKFSLLSFLCGLISLLGNSYLLFIYSPFYHYFSVIEYVGAIFLIGGIFVFPLLGLIFGILSRKEKLGRIGIILSLIGLISGLGIYWMALKIGWG